ncbi:MAG: hypothetical protein IPM12_16395 [Flavobacteriales bacterium]|nr:hypothetical protein [Flavobacteriales bacterium]
MRNLAVALVLLPLSTSGQLAVWGEEFENACMGGCYASAYIGPNGAWSITNTGANGACANRWFISCRENGQAAGACGAGCGNNETLHVGNDISCISPNGCFFCPSGDCGAAYDAGCPPALCAFCCSCNSSQTDQRAESPVIDLTGLAGLTLSFKYMENGQGATDNATLWFYNGSVWTQLIDLPKTPVCGSGQGQWTSYSIALPASADNNPNVRIGFRWVNNNDGSGADPSFAVDDVQLTIPFSAPGTGLIVNELSNGPSGAKEYVELIAVGPPCSTIDIRGIKVDDNNGALYNGFGATLVNSGTAAGHLRFASIGQWAAVPTGSIILLYNNTDPNASLPPDDPSDASPADKRYILPVSHASMQGCGSSPNPASTSGYFNCAWGAGNWNYMSFRNEGDAAQTRDAQGRYFHGISYGTNGQNMNNGGLDNLRISAMDHTGRVLFFNSGNYRVAANFTSAGVAGVETPGAPNNPANLAFIATFDCPLPIELLTFTAQEEDRVARLRWSTANEQGNAWFIVERSTDAQRFMPIAQLPGAGDSHERRDYIFDDAQPLPGIGYYRLRQVDLDGGGSLSQVVALSRSAIPGLWASQGADGRLRIGGGDGAARLEMSDALGRLLLRKAIDQWPIELVPPQRALGLVVITVDSGSGRWSTRMVLD